jgi:hypothetical protein
MEIISGEDLRVDYFQNLLEARGLHPLKKSSRPSRRVSRSKKSFSSNRLQAGPGIFGLITSKLTQRSGACGGQISPGSTGRVKDLTKGPRAQYIVRSFFRGPGEGQSAKQIDMRPDGCKPGRPTTTSERPQQRSDFPALEPPCNGAMRG